MSSYPKLPTIDPRVTAYLDGLDRRSNAFDLLCIAIVVAFILSSLQ